MICVNRGHACDLAYNRVLVITLSCYVCSVQFRLVEVSIYMLRKTHMHSTPFLRSFPALPLKTIPLLHWLMRVLSGSNEKCESVFGWLVNCSYMDGQHQRVDIYAHARTAHKGRGSPLSHPSCPPDDPIGQGTELSVQKKNPRAVSPVPVSPLCVQQAPRLLHTLKVPCPF